MDLAAMASRIGKSIRVYLSDGDVAGIRHAEIVNWTGQALAFSRNSLADLKEWPEVRRQGVYFLVGIDEETGRDLVYIGGSGGSLRSTAPARCRQRFLVRVHRGHEQRREPDEVPHQVS